MTAKATRTWVLALTSVASLMVALDALVVTTALSTIRVDLGASIEQLEWTVNAYNLSFAVLLMTAAAVGDRIGRRAMFAAGLGLFVAASAGCALAPDVGWLIAARAVQGVGAAMITPVALALLSANFPAELRGKAMGMFAGITGLAVLGGPVVGGAIAQGAAWQWIFWLNVPIGLAAIPLVLRRIPESYGRRARIDLGGLALVTGAALGIVWGLVRGNQAGWGSLEVIGTLAAGAVLAAAFVAWELRAREPMLPMGFFRSRAFSAGNASVFFLLASLFGAVFFLAQFLQTSLGHGPLDTGLRLMPWTATLFIVAPIAGSLVNRVGERPLIVGGLLLQTIGMASIALMASPTMAYADMVPALVVAGTGVSMAIPATQSVIMGALGPTEAGKASGTYNMVRQLGGVFGIAILVAVFSGAGSYASPQAFSDGFGPALAVTAGLALVGALTALGLPGRRSVFAPAPAAVVAETAR
jgi:EmrB/QacA subfamily drug resistance transporter